MDRGSITARITMQTIGVLVWALCVCVPIGINGTAIPSNKKKKEPCDQFYFYDHGTDYCEHCGDICDAADIKGTMDDCWKQCQSYALMLWPPKQKQPILAPSKQEVPVLTDGGNAQNSDDSTFPLAAQITLPVVGVVVLAGVLLALAVIIRRRKNTRNNHRPPTTHPPLLFTVNRAMEQTATVDQAETIPLNPIGENSTSTTTDISARATQGTETSFSIQEEAGTGGEEGGPAGGRVTIVTQATPSHQDHVSTTPHGPGRMSAPLSTVLHHPIMVSPEGNSASFAMALPSSPKRRYPPVTSRRHASLTDLDLDSTELKTLLPSMSDDSVLAGPGED